MQADTEDFRNGAVPPGAVQTPRAGAGIDEWFAEEGTGALTMLTLGGWRRLRWTANALMGCRDRVYQTDAAAAAILRVALETGSCAKRENARMRVRGKIGEFWDAREKRKEGDYLRNVTPHQQASVRATSEGTSIRRVEAEVCPQFGLGMPGNFNGGELPHARKEDIVMRAGVS